MNITVLVQKSSNLIVLFYGKSMPFCTVIQNTTDVIIGVDLEGRLW